jgi:hypothetical protein
MKLFALTVLFAVACLGAWSQVPRDRSQQQKQPQPHDEKAQPTKQPCVCTVQVQETPPKEEHSPQRKSYQWRELYAPTNVPNWVLALVAGWAGIMALKTLWAIRKQSDIQAAALRQWIDVQVTNCECEVIYPRGLVKITGETIKIWFSAANPTPYPLTIQEVVVKISRKRPDGPKWETYSRKEEIILPPKGREAEQGNTFEHRFFVPLDLNGEMIEECQNSSLLVSISGHISFRPVIGQVERHAFGYLILCGPNNVNVLRSGSELGKSGEVSEQREQQSRRENPN